MHWAPVSASVDWCEQNYVHSNYIAEFWNTLSSVPLCLVALVGLAFAVKFKYPTRVIVCYAGLFVVGLGSIAFHGTLTHAGQALDELSMLWTVTALFYCILDERDLTRYPPSLVIPALLAFDCALTAVYWFAPFYFSFFIVVYVGIVYVLITRAYRIAFGSPVAAAGDAAADASPAAAIAAATPAQRIALQTLVRIAVFNYVGGSLFFWIPEMFVICVPNGYLQLHALFHITSAIGAYSFIVFATLFHYIVFTNKTASAQPLVGPLYYIQVKTSAA
jgi:hypothetical protein